MQNARVWQRVLGLVDTVIEGVVIDDAAGAVVVSVRPRKGRCRRCGRCGRRSSLYDQGDGRRRWRGVDLGSLRVFLEADSPRVTCAEHGPTVTEVPWARHRAGHTRDFDDTVAWLAVHTSKSAVVELMRVAWRTVGAIVARVSADLSNSAGRLEGLRRIGIDEISYRRGSHYLTVVVDHDTRRLVWASPGRHDATVHRFFDDLGPDRTGQITHISADAAPWIGRVVAKRCPHAALCIDPFHVVAWATEALDEVRRQAWNDARGGRPQRQGGLRRANWNKKSHPLKRVRWALWKNPDRLSDPQRHQLQWVADNHPRVWRAYRLKEGLRYVFKCQDPHEAKHALASWLAWAGRSQLEPFVAVARMIRRCRPGVEAALDHKLSNALVESTNTKIRLIHRRAFGFHSAEALIGLAMLSLGQPRPALPGRR